MNEVRALVEAFDTAVASGERCALATIVSVEGSSYRRPGARMLICETGATAGTISAGCLENDVVEHAKGVVETGEAKLVEYNNGTTTDEMAWGLGLGCNGIMRILVEPLAPGSPYIDALRRSLEERADSAYECVATVYEYTPSETASNAADIVIGSRLFIEDGDKIKRDKFSAYGAGIMESEVRALIRSGKTSGVFNINVNGSVAKVFIETLLPPVPLVIFGAGQDALPIVELARGLGWQTQIVDPQERPASRSRFALADGVTLARPENVESQVTIAPQTMALLMSHNYSHDLALLKFLLASPARYIGVMGPRKRTERMLNELAASTELAVPDESNLARVHSPVGLDVGANGPAEIALSIVAEMCAVLNERDGGMLRERSGLINSGPSVGCSPTMYAASKNGDLVTNESNPERVGAVILAAGSSSRLGRPKQTLQFEGVSLLRRAALAALGAGCTPVIVVTGANAEPSRRELGGLDVTEVWNPRWASGMSSSIAEGLKGLLAADPNAAATVVMLCDQPHVTADVISRLISAHRLTRLSVIASKYGASCGVPALFSNPLFGELACLEGNAGAKEVIRRNASEAHFVDFPGGAVDVDTEEDFARLIAKAQMHEIHVAG